jgi:insulysin
MQELSHENSALDRFWFGNIKSLKHPEIRDELLEFHSKWYSANIMKLCLSGNQSI